MLRGSLLSTISAFLVYELQILPARAAATCLSFSPYPAHANKDPSVVKSLHQNTQQKQH